MFCKLILVEGMPCTGKSTMSKKIADSLKAKGINVGYFDEGDSDHPSDHEFCAFIKNEVLSEFSAEEQAYIKENGDKYDIGYVVSLLMLDSEMLDKCVIYKIYDSLAWDEEKDIMLAKWERFVKMALAEEKLYVFNSCFLQNYLSEMMIRFDLPMNEILDFMEKLYKIIAPLNPILIYLESTSIRFRIGDIAKTREKWLESVINYYTTQGYGLKHNYIGFDGFIRCIEERQRRELAIIQSLNILNQSIKDPYEDYEQSFNSAMEFIETFLQ